MEAAQASCRKISLRKLHHNGCQDGCTKTADSKAAPQQLSRWLPKKGARWLEMAAEDAARMDAEKGCPKAAKKLHNNSCTDMLHKKAVKQLHNKKAVKMSAPYGCQLHKIL